MKKDLVKAIVLTVVGGLCIVRGLQGFRVDNHDYAGDGLYAGMAHAVNTEMIRQANDSALQMIAVGTLVLLAASKPWREYKREKAERNALYNIDEEEVSD